MQPNCDGDKLSRITLVVHIIVDSTVLLTECVKGKHHFTISWKYLGLQPANTEVLTFIYMNHL